MLKSLALASALLCALTVNSEARQRAAVSCVETGTVMRPACTGKDNNPFSGARSIRVTMHRVGTAPKANKTRHKSRVLASEGTAHPDTVMSMAGISPVIVAHPAGCPARAFCGCGAAVRVFGHSVRELWLAANWFKFPRAAPAPGMAAVRRHHVFVLETDLGGGVWQVFDANSGRHLTRIHARSIAGFVIVNPHGAG